MNRLLSDQYGSHNGGEVMQDRSFKGNCAVHEKIAEKEIQKQVYGLLTYQGTFQVQFLAFPARWSLHGVSLQIQQLH